MNKNRTCPPEFIGENRDPRRYPAPNTPPKPKFIDALEITDDAEQYSTPVKKDPKTGLLYSNAGHLVKQSDAKHEAEEERLDNLIDEESKNRYAHVMAIDEVNQHRVNEEKAARESQDIILGNRIDQHEVKVDELHVEANRVHNSKLDKNFANAEISTLPVSSSDYVVIVSNGNTYRVTLEQLKVLLTSSIDYFKGIFVDYDHLSDAVSVGKNGDYALVGSKDDKQFVMYVWDDRELKWEETTSSQYATQADYTALVQSLLDGTFNLGSVKANSSPEESPLLTSLHVNQKDYSLPSVELEFSDDVVEGANDLNSIKINGNVWNIPKFNVELKLSSKHKKDAMQLGSITVNDDAWNIGDKFIDVSTEPAPTAPRASTITVGDTTYNLEQNCNFSEFELGKKIYKGEHISLDNVENPDAIGDIYKFKTGPDSEVQGTYTIQYNTRGDKLFFYRYDGENNSGSGYSTGPSFNEPYIELIEIQKVNGYRLGTHSNTLTLELSSERQEGANDLGSIRIGEDVWNMPQGGGSGSAPKEYTFSGVPVYMGDDLIPHLCGVEITDAEIINEIKKVINRENIVQVYYDDGYDISKSSYLFTSAINFFTMDVITTGGLPSSGHGVAIICMNNQYYYCDTDFWDSNDSTAITKTINLTFKFIELGNYSGGNSQNTSVITRTITSDPVAITGWVGFDTRSIYNDSLANLISTAGHYQIKISNILITRLGNISFDIDGYIQAVSGGGYISTMANFSSFNIYVNEPTMGISGVLNGIAMITEAGDTCIKVIYNDTIITDELSTTVVQLVSNLSIVKTSVE